MTGRVGITGHQDRADIDWHWTRQAVRSELAKLSLVSEAFSSLAAGSDQLFASIALDLCIKLVAVIPISNYERFFDPKTLLIYRRLLSQSKIVRLDSSKDENKAFLHAGYYISDRSDTMFAIWDGNKSEGLGGTADIVEYALDKGRSVLHIDPIKLKIKRIS